MQKSGQFKKYSNYYDLIYKDKDYQKESEFILNIIKHYGNKQSRGGLLSLGCGTGTYETILLPNFKKIIGVDRSEEMIRLADQKIVNLKTKNLEFKIGDVRKFRTRQKFDTAMAMFNIAGYQITNGDLEKFIKTASFHLKEDGLFLFDAWYQPAVFKHRPTDKIKEIQLADGVSIVRKTTQTLDLERSVLDIRFEVGEFKNGKAVQSMVERHPMRFFTINETAYFLEKGGFKLVKICKFTDLNTPMSEDEWNMFVIAKKV